MSDVLVGTVGFIIVYLLIGIFVANNEGCTWYGSRVEPKKLRSVFNWSFRAAKAVWGNWEW